MACACAAETMEPPAVPETESKTPAPQLPLSEVNAESSKTEEPAAPSEIEPQGTISMEESEIELEPIQPIVPVEKETTLEKVLSFDIGIDGIYQYAFIFYDDPSGAQITNRGNLYVAGDGKFYHTVDNKFVCLSDGTQLPFSFNSQIGAVEICEDLLYVLTRRGVCYQFDISDGLGNAELVNELQLYDPWEELATITSFDGKTILVRGYEQDGVYWSLSGPYYTLDKNIVSNADVLFAYVNRSNEKTADLQYVQDGSAHWEVNEEEYSVSSVSSEKILVSERNVRDGTCVLTSIDRNGNILSRFAVSIDYSGTIVPCEVPFEHAGDYFVAKEYTPNTVTIGDIVIENLLDCSVVSDIHGNVYLAAYTLDGCVIYRINPGYTGESFADTDEELQAGDSSIAPTSSASGSSASSVKWVDVTREQARANAQAMIDLDWTIRNGNLDERTNAELPTYLDPEETETEVGDQEYGIPYCKGGNYGEEEFRFKQQDDLGGGYYRMTGNIKDVSGHQTQTIGLDCARFVGQALEFTSQSGYSPSQFINLGYGHEVSSLSQLDSMDLLINSGHAMFYSRIGADDNDTIAGAVVWVYDVTSTNAPEVTAERSIGFTPENFDANAGYRYFHIYSTVGYDSTQHWTECASCGQYKSGYENHTMELSESGHFQKCTGCDYMVALTPHTFTYTPDGSGHVATCTDCGYSVTATHSMNYTSSDADRHILSCSCGYSVPEAHTFSESYENHGSTHGRSCDCGYTETIAHTLSYHYDTNTHWRECSVCDYETLPLNHTFVGGYCSVCGAGNLIIAALPPEDEPLLVPEDQKATL